jgi:tetratricopeptide (TPR) repeat protein
MLARAGRAEDAVALLENTARCEPNNPTLWRLISAAESQRDDLEAALIAVGRAIDLAADNAEYHLHRGHLLYRAGDFDAAADAIANAAGLDPASHAAQRTQIDMLLADGRLTDATALGGELLRAFPEDSRSAETVLRVLNQRLDTIDGDYIVVGDRIRRLPERPRPTPGFAERTRTQLRVVHALIIRETRTRFGDSRLGYGWALLEPILHIALLSAVFSLLMRGSPPIGTNFFVFYFTGLIRYSGANGTSKAVTPNGGTNVFSADRVSWAG